MAVVIVTSPIPRRWAPIALPVLHLPAGIVQLAPFVLALLLYPAFFLSVTSEAVTTGSSVEKLRLERDNWRHQNRQLEFELSKLQSLAWVENEAVKRLGMRPSRPAIYMSMDRPPPASDRLLPRSLARHESTQRNPLLVTETGVEISTVPSIPGQRP
ncbi:MAG: hypothetical protein ACKVVP_11520 [Chloroflexota bacterium]